MCWQIHKLLLNGFTGISRCYNVNLQSSSLSKNFKKCRLFEKYKEVGNTSIAEFNALFHIPPPHPKILSFQNCNISVILTLSLNTKPFHFLCLGKKTIILQKI